MFLRFKRAFMSKPNPNDDPNEIEMTGYVLVADLKPGGIFNAGTLMVYDPATCQIDRYRHGSGGQPCGILYITCDATNPAEKKQGRVQQKGVFLRHEIEKATGILIRAGSDFERQLNDVGIFLDDSFPEEEPDWR